MKDTKKEILWRVYLVYFGVLIFAIMIIYRAAYLQFSHKDELLEKAKKQEIKYFPIEAFLYICVHPSLPILTKTL